MLLLVVTLVLSLYFEWLKVAKAFLILIIVFLLFGLTDMPHVLESLANKQIITIVVLVLITTALSKNFNVDEFFDKIFAFASSPKEFLIQMMLYVGSISSVLNNTPVVAVMTPYVYKWCKRNGAYPSKMLIPLSYITILGGMITVIGTSTNMVLNGMIEQQEHLHLLGFFDFFFPGVMVMGIGLLYFYTYGYKLLPNNKEAFTEVKVIAPEYLVETRLVRGSELDGIELQKTAIKNFVGAYLVEVHRAQETITSFAEGFTLQANDVLLFMGKTETIMAMVQADIGLELPKHNEEQEIVEAVVPANSPLAGHTVGKANFNDRYKAEVLAVHRNGEKLSGATDDVTLQAGDLLLLSVSETFISNSASIKDIYVLSKLGKQKVNNKNKMNLLFGGAALSVVFLALGFFDLLLAVFLILSLFILLNLMTLRQLSQEIDFDLIIVLVGALVVGNAMVATGAGELLGGAIIALLRPFGSLGMLVGIYVLTVMITSFVTNVAAVSVAFPIALSVTQSLNADTTPFFLAIAFAASAAFLTPFGYQTNWLVYGPGGYKPRDFFKVGLPLLVVYSVAVIGYLSLYYHMY